MQTEIIRRRCDFCNTVEDFPKEGRMSDAQRLSMDAWIVLGKMYVIQDQMYPVTKHACRDSCAQNLISTGALSLPPEVAEAAKRAS